MYSGTRLISLSAYFSTCIQVTVGVELLIERISDADIDAVETDALQE
jgi:hypothetical protein